MLQSCRVRSWTSPVLYWVRETFSPSWIVWSSLVEGICMFTFVEHSLWSIHFTSICRCAHGHKFLSLVAESYNARCHQNHTCGRYPLQHVWVRVRHQTADPNILFGFYPHVYTWVKHILDGWFNVMHPCFHPVYVAGMPMGRLASPQPPQPPKKWDVGQKKGLINAPRTFYLSSTSTSTEKI